MFDNARYITNGTNNTIPLYTQNLMWYLIETMRVKVKDHLQIFELEEYAHNEVVKQKIIHKQECPKYRKEYLLPFGNTITAKIYVIDDGEHTTMLLAEEY